MRYRRWMALAASMLLIMNGIPCAAEELTGEEETVEADPEEINKSEGAVSDEDSWLIEAEESEDVVEDGCAARDAPSGDEADSGPGCGCYPE